MMLTLKKKCSQTNVFALSEHRSPWTPPWWNACYVTLCSQACQNQSQPTRQQLLPSQTSQQHQACWGWWWCGGHESARPPWPADVAVPRRRPRWPPWRRRPCCCRSEAAAGRDTRGGGRSWEAGGGRLVSCPADLARWQCESAPVSSVHLNPGEGTELEVRGQWKVKQAENSLSVLFYVRLKCDNSFRVHACVWL